MPADPAARWARACWAAAEPFALTAFFGPEAGAAMERIGLPARSSYVVLRAAPLGAAHPAAVAAAFRSFPRRAFDVVLPAAWARISPDEAVQQAHEAVTTGYGTLLADHPGCADVAAVADRLTEVVPGLDTGGRPLAAGNQAVAPPEEPWARLWRAVTTLREHRGDGHVAALLAADLDVPESEVLMAAWAGDRLDLPMLRRTRGITDESWAAARARLAARGLLTGTGGLTDAGRSLRDRTEAVTDTAAAAPYARLGRDGTRRLWQLTGDLSQALLDAGRIRSVTPVGAPWPPPDPDGDR